MGIIITEIYQLIEENKVKKSTIHALFRLFKQGYKPTQIQNRHIDLYRDRRFRQ